MPEPESPQVRRDRVSSLVVACLACLAFPTLVVLVFDVPGSPAGRRDPLLWLAAATAVGMLLPFLYWAPYRALGLVPLAAVGWLAAAAHGAYWHQWPGWAHGLFLGVIAGALARGRRGPEPVEDNYWLAAAVLAGAGIAWGFVVGGRPYDAAGYVVLAVAGAVLVWAWARLFRPAFELTCEPVVWVMYRVRGAGPGLPAFPRTGPCLVLANHACWLDPLFLAKVLPRPVTPMMTSRFYDLPGVRRLVVAFGVIRVPERAIKKETPEIAAAIAALDRGECVVVFPEGYLRRNEDKMLRRFGQGVWQILQARPNTPVFTCWIEGAWGSYTSYFNGRPMRNKKRDFRRPIGVGVAAAESVPADVLAEHLRTRVHLMNLVAAVRRHLGLPPLPPFELPARGEAEEPGEPG